MIRTHHDSNNGASRSACNHIPTISTGPCPLTVAGPYAAWMPRKSLHGRPCGVSCDGGRARALQSGPRSAALQPSRSPAAQQRRPRSSALHRQPEGVLSAAPRATHKTAGRTIRRAQPSSGAASTTRSTPPTPLTAQNPRVFDAPFPTRAAPRVKPCPAVAIPDSRFPIPDSRFPIPQSPIPNPQSPLRKLPGSRSAA
ncbi:hypothetical protein FHT08_003518 [Xanthomonas campestris]|nr:hypothetical protein [Xanthomonas sp. CFBP 8151]